MKNVRGFIPPHGGYQNLRSYRKALMVFQATVTFCERLLNKRDLTYDQMIQAGRSGKQNIIEASMASGTSRELEQAFLKEGGLCERMTPTKINQRNRSYA